jgi:hypothetical protein
MTDPILEALRRLTDAASLLAQRLDLQDAKLRLICSALGIHSDAPVAPSPAPVRPTWENGGLARGVE